jgi:Tol biopolymer transport system component
VYASVRESKSSIWRVPLAGGETVRLTDQDSAYPRVSPDGKLIACAYRVKEDSPWHVALLPVEGGAPVRLFEVPRTASFLDSIHWTPDGKAVCYRDAANGIWEQSIKGGEPRRLAGLPRERILSFGWSSDGKQFAFARGSEMRDVILIRDHE